MAASKAERISKQIAANTPSKFDPTLIFTLLTMLLDCWKQRNPTAKTDAELQKAFADRYARAPKSTTNDVVRAIRRKSIDDGDPMSLKECREVADEVIREALAAKPADWSVF